MPTLSPHWHARSFVSAAKTLTFKELLERLMIGATRPVFVIVDGRPIHKSRLVQDFVDGLDGQLKLFYLPPYSPHLNRTNRYGLTSSVALASRPYRPKAT